MKKLVIASNMYNEIDQIKGWMENVKKIADGGILIVDTGSRDGTIEYCKKNGAVVVVNDIIRSQGYGPARNHLRYESKNHFPNAHWMMYLDADERIMEEDFHHLRWIKDYLIGQYDVVGFPRIDWRDLQMKEAAKDWKIAPDWQARMTRLGSPIKYVRRLHEQLTGHKAIFLDLMSPKIHHFHRTTGQKKRDLIGKLCAKLHMEDEYKDTYPMHHKEQYYRDLLEKEGL